MRTPRQVLEAARAYGEDLAAEVRRGTEVARRGAEIARRAGVVLRAAGRLYEEGARARGARIAAQRAARRGSGGSG